MPTEKGPMTHGLVIHWAARYDVLAWLLTRGKERAFRERIISLAGLEQGDAVLDVGCGTGTLAIAAARHVGRAGRVYGIDASPSMIARARRKAARAGADVAFQPAAAETLPFPDGQFDRVLSTLMLHHLPRNTRRLCVREIHRVLRPGGRVLAVDFGRSRQTGLLARFHRHGHVDIQEVAALFADAGLTGVSSGPVGVHDLQFVLADAPGGVTADAE